MSKRQQSLAHNAAAVREWRAKGWNERSINRMLICSLELTRSCHPNPIADALIVLEIANGQRCA